MAQRVIIPRMGQTMTEGTVAKFYVGDGDSVKVGDDIYELEYDKASAAIQAKAQGVVRLLCAQGDTVPLGEAVAVILENGETLESVDVHGEHQVANAAKAGDALKEEKPAQAKQAEIKPFGITLASPLARRRAAEAGVSLEDIVPSRADRVIRAADIKAPVKAVEHSCGECRKCGTLITPLARKLAAERNIDIEKIKPADGARIYKQDVLNYVPEAKPLRRGRREKVSGMRKVIAQRMSQSYFTYPTVTLNSTADMGELLKLRSQLNEELEPKGIKLSITDMLIKAVAMALARHEIINASLDGDEIVFNGDINVGVAVALDKGLVVPVVKNADTLSLEETSREAKRLIKQAKDGSIGGDDMSGGTFSITNLGTEGIDTFNPIINYPESAILGIGRTVETPVVRDGQVVIRPIMSLSITHDHRVIDGVPAAEFLKTVVKYIERPFLLLMD